MSSKKSKRRKALQQGVDKTKMPKLNLNENPYKMNRSDIMNISNEKLQKYDAKIKELFATINDVNESKATLLARFPLVKQNLNTLADTLLKAKEGVQDAIVIAEIDYLVKEISTGIATFGAKHLGVGNVPTVNNNEQPVEKETPKEVIEKAIENAAQQSRHLTHPAPMQPITNASYYILDGDTIIGTAHSEAQLKTYLAVNYVEQGKPMPGVIIGRKVQPKVKTEIDL